MTLKSNEQDHLMMIVVVHPQLLSKVLRKNLISFFHCGHFNQNELDQMKKDLRDYFIDGEGRECELNSIYFQTW
jgi:hypothetical protein